MAKEKVKTAKKENTAKNHILVPKHTKLNAQEKKDLLAKYNIWVDNLPKIKKDDPALAEMNVKQGDVVKIDRKSTTHGTSVYYRGVIND